MLDGKKTGIVLLFSIFFILSVFVGNYSQKVAGQSTVDPERQQIIEKFLELGEEGWTKYCLGLGFDKSGCKSLVNQIKPEAESFQQNQNQASNNTNIPTTKLQYVDNENGYSLEYPSDWHQIGRDISKGTREFSTELYKNPEVSLVDTPFFADTMLDVYLKKDNTKLIEKHSKLIIDGEPAVSFSFSQDDKATMVAALMHNNVGYVFKYETLKKNFDKDTDTALDFFSSIRFLN